MIEDDMNNKAPSTMKARVFAVARHLIDIWLRTVSGVDKPSPLVTFAYWLCGGALTFGAVLLITGNSKLAVAIFILDLIMKPILYGVIEPDATTAKNLSPQSSDARTSRVTSTMPAADSSGAPMEANQRQGAVIWFTGLPSSGKSTLAEALIQRLEAIGAPREWLDGDAVRAKLGTTGFSEEARKAHLATMGVVSMFLERHGVLVVSSFVSPYRESRDRARHLARNFIEVYVATPLEVCEARDPKGLYAKARRGEITGMTGVDAPYDPPTDPEIVIDTTNESISDGASRIMAYLGARGLLAKNDDDASGVHPSLIRPSAVAPLSIVP